MSNTHCITIAAIVSGAVGKSSILMTTEPSFNRERMVSDASFLLYSSLFLLQWALLIVITVTAAIHT